MFRGAEYFSFGVGNVLATSGDDEHWKFDAFIKETKTETAVFLLKPTKTDRQRKF